MISLWLAVAAAAPAVELEAAAGRALAEQFERVGRSAPAADPGLTKAARALAARALDSSAGEAAELLTLTAALSEAGGYDATPRTLVLRGSPSSEPLHALSKRTDLGAEPATHLGIGAIKRGDLAALVVLLAERRAVLEPFTRVFPKRPAASQRLCATLLPPLTSAEVFVTRPNGAVDRLPMPDDRGRRCAWLDFPTDGRHAIEVLGRGDRGPQVAALFFVQVGAALAREALVAEREPLGVEEARGRISLRINALRAGSAVAAVARDFELDAVAQGYAERLAAENFFAHVAPDGEDLKGRLKRADYRYLAAGENLGLASGPLAAHFSIEHSPGHRKNLIDPAYTRVGIGAARNALGQSLVVEVLASPAVARPEEDPAAQALRAIDEVRRLKGLRPLKRAAVLDQLAGSHARRALELDTPKAKLKDENLHDRVFAARDDLRTATVDVFVTDSCALATDSKNLLDPRADVIGVGVAKGDSKTFGTGKFWLVVIYASTLE